MLTLLLSLSLSASNAKFCDAFAGAPSKGGFVVIPPKCEGACADFTPRLLACLAKLGQVTSPDALAKTVDEKALSSAMGEQGDGSLREMAQTFGSKHLVLSETRMVGKERWALVRIIAVESGTIELAVRAALDETGENKSLEQSLAALAEKLATSLRALSGAKTKRIAVLTFQENGDVARKNSLGTVVSAELIMRFRRDYGVQIVERSKLDAVMKEIELGQSGVVDQAKAPEFGKMLEADALVLGSAVDTGDKVRVYAQLVDTLTGATLVADSVQLQSATLISLSSDAVVLRTRSGALFRSLLIPGWGQFYNRQPIKGGAFIGIALALGGGIAATQIASMLAAQDYARAPAGSNFEALAQRSESFAIASLSIGIGLAAFWIYNVIDAYANGTTFDSAIQAQSSGGGVRF